MICWECEKETEHIHEHHVVPRSRGGTKTVSLCMTCHGLAHHRKKGMSSSQLILDGLQKRKDRGERVGRPPFGFTVNRDGRLIPKKDAWMVVRAIELRANKQPLRVVAAELGISMNKAQRICSYWKKRGDLEEVMKFKPDLHGNFANTSSPDE